MAVNTWVRLNMAARLVQRPQVEADLDEIWLFIAADNPDAADRLVDRIGGVFQLLQENPQAGRQRPELGRGVRSFAVGNYVVLYLALQDAVHVVRVLHGARDITADDVE